MSGSDTFISTSPETTHPASVVTYPGSIVPILASPIAPMATMTVPPTVVTHQPVVQSSFVITYTSNSETFISVVPETTLSGSIVTHPVSTVTVHAPTATSIITVPQSIVTYKPTIVPSSVVTVTSESYTHFSVVPPTTIPGSVVIHPEATITITIISEVPAPVRAVVSTIIVGPSVVTHTESVQPSTVVTIDTVKPAISLFQNIHIPGQWLHILSERLHLLSLPTLSSRSIGSLVPVITSPTPPFVSESCTTIVSDGYTIIKTIPASTIPQSVITSNRNWMMSNSQASSQKFYGNTTIISETPVTISMNDSATLPLSTTTGIWNGPIVNATSNLDLSGNLVTTSTKPQAVQLSSTQLHTAVTSGQDNETADDSSVLGDKISILGDDPSTSYEISESTDWLTATSDSFKLTGEGYSTGVIVGNPTVIVPTPYDDPSLLSVVHHVQTATEPGYEVEMDNSANNRDALSRVRVPYLATPSPGLDDANIDSRSEERNNDDSGTSDYNNFDDSGYGTDGSIDDNWHQFDSRPKTVLCKGYGPEYKIPEAIDDSCSKGCLDDYKKCNGESCTEWLMQCRCANGVENACSFQY